MSSNGDLRQMWKRRVHFGSRLRTFRLVAGLTQTELALCILPDGMTVETCQTVISRIERGVCKRENVPTVYLVTDRILQRFPSLRANR